MLKMPKRILIVDDESAIVDILSKFLYNAGFEVISATDGRTGLNLANKYIPDLIILDVNMPNMNGGEVMAIILKEERLKNIPVIFLTGLISNNEANINNDKSVDRVYMSKSLDLPEQIKIIKKVLKV